MQLISPDTYKNIMRVYVQHIHTVGTAQHGGRIDCHNIEFI